LVDHRLKSDWKTQSTKVKWSNGECTWEPPHVDEDDLATCAKHAKDSDLLELPWRKRFERLAKQEKTSVRMFWQAFKAKQRSAIKFEFGIGIPGNFGEAKELESKNANALWQEALTKEMDQMKACQTFVHLEEGTKILKGHQKIHAHIIVWDCKFDWRRKAVWRPWDV